jgi:hypothetical protein
MMSKKKGEKMLRKIYAQNLEYPVYINPDQITMVSPVDPEDKGNGDKTISFSDGNSIEVTNFAWKELFMAERMKYYKGLNREASDAKKDSANK